MRTEARRIEGLNAFPRSRYVLFGLIALATLGTDLYSKHLVFRDLGYPAGATTPDALGAYEVFPALIGPDGDKWHGRTPFLLEGWVQFGLYTSFNEGALWGRMQGWSWLFASLSVIAVAGVLYWLFARGAAASRWLTVALAFISGGALGNLYDRMGLHGIVEIGTGQVRFAVRDFLLFVFGGWPWPVFNLADAFLVTGAIMLVLQSFLSPDGPPQDDTNSATATDSPKAAQHSPTR